MTKKVSVFLQKKEDIDSLIDGNWWLIGGRNIKICEFGFATMNLLKFA